MSETTDSPPSDEAPSAHATEKKSREPWSIALVAAVVGALGALFGAGVGVGGGVLTTKLTLAHEDAVNNRADRANAYHLFLEATLRQEAYLESLNTIAFGADLIERQQAAKRAGTFNTFLINSVAEGDAKSTAGMRAMDSAYSNLEVYANPRVESVARDLYFDMLGGLIESTTVYEGRGVDMRLGRQTARLDVEIDLFTQYIRQDLGIDAH